MSSDPLELIWAGLAGLELPDAAYRRAMRAVSAALEADTATPGAVDRFAVERWDAFRDAAPDNPNYLVDGLLVAGALGFIGGAPKNGKTWLAAELSVAVATGTPFCEHFGVPRHGTVLYLALEGNRSAMRTRIGAISRTHGVDPAASDSSLLNLHVSYKPRGFDLMDPAWAADLAAAVLALDPALVVVDVLRAAAPRLKESGEGANDFALIRNHLQPMLDDGVTIMLCHHEIKPSDHAKGRSAGQRLAGSGALYGACDVLLAVRSKEEDRTALRVDHEARDIASNDPFGVYLSGTQSGIFGGWSYADTIRVVHGRDVPEALR